MLRKTLIATFCTLAISGTALAGHCPKDANAIDNALGKTNLTMSEKKEIQAMRDKGMELHKAGSHRASEKVLAEAMRRVLNAI